PRAAWRSTDDGEGRPGLGDGSLDETELWRAVRHLPAVQTALDRMWPLLSPEELLHDLYGAPALLRLAGRGLMSEEEQATLHRPRSTSLDAIPWTAADLALLDEARLLLGPRRAAAGEDDDVRAYGHIVVDEAQDLSPMQLRMLARRSLSGSMTVVGDIAQATGQRAPATWDEVTAHLPNRHPPRISELTVNYRTPGEIMDLAARVLAVTAPHLQPPRSVRTTGAGPVVTAASPAELSTTVARVVAGDVGDAAVGTVAVVAPPSLTAAVGGALSGAGIPFGDAAHNALESRVSLVPPSMVKGLEFDVVVVVEPAAIVAESSQGLRALYVALTRATRRLTVLHAEALPEPLLAAPPSPRAEGEALGRLGG
ncbi:MAG TPA: ATP-binding domain-containing protein, partial [Acidimicrobiales bacterium]|nr:ATP-binding domain-containing protein [Acidimicrobiales bacterium]